MKETISISASHQANHVMTHLFNNQESHLSYSRDTPSLYNNAAYLAPNKSNQGTINYYPRAMLYDLAGANGSLGKYEYHEPVKNGAQSYIDESMPVIRPFTPVPKNEYQQALDTGKPVNRDLLNTNNTKYWSDYNKLIYNPRSLNYLSDWVHDPSSTIGYHRNSTDETNKKKFDLWYMGAEEAKKCLEDQLETFRVLLENCDLFQGANIFTEIGSAWGGFTNELLTEIKDEYFNSSAKYSFWTWAIDTNASDLNFKQKYSQIKTFFNLVANSSMFMPLSIPSGTLPLTNSQFQKNSLWHTSALMAIPIDSLWNITNPLKNPTSMITFEEDLLRGSNRNIVGEINLNSIAPAASTGSEQQESNALINNVNLLDLYNTAALSNINPSNPSINYSNNIFTANKYQYFSKSYIIPENVHVDLESVNKLHKDSQPHYHINTYKSDKLTLTENDSFPAIIDIQHQNNLYTEFAVGTQPCNYLKDCKVFLRRSSSITTKVLETDYEEHSSLIEQVGNLIEDYTVEWEDDEEWE